jgi:hypothetical protein
MITESWLSDDIGDASVKIGNKYNYIFRRDRKSPGGGVIAYVNNCLPAERMTHLEEENKEVIWLLLKPPEPLDLTVQSLLLLCTTPLVNPPK